MKIVFFCSPKKHSPSSKITLTLPIKLWLGSEYNELHTTYGVRLPHSCLFSTISSGVKLL
jgi:hypothetical protein